MIAAYPQVPTGYDLGINCAVESYDGKLFFGLIADAQAASDVSRLRDFLYVSFQELCRAARKQALAAATQPRATERTCWSAGGSARKRAAKPAAAISSVIPEPVTASAAPTMPAAPGDEVARRPRPARKRVAKPAAAAAPVIPGPPTPGPPATLPSAPDDQASSGA